MNHNLVEALGLSAEEIRERIIEKAVDRVLSSTGYNENSDEYTTNSRAYNDLVSQISKRATEQVQRIYDEKISGLLGERVENLILQETNRWGEKTGKPLTLIEFLVAKAESYMTEGVDYNGQPKSRDGYNWRQSGTRIDYAIDQYLKYHIETAMKQVIGDGNKILVKALQETCRIKISEIATALEKKVKAI